MMAPVVITVAEGMWCSRAWRTSCHLSEGIDKFDYFSQEQWSGFDVSFLYIVSLADVMKSLKDSEHSGFSTCTHSEATGDGQPVSLILLHQSLLTLEQRALIIEMDSEMLHLSTSRVVYYMKSESINRFNKFMWSAPWPSYYQRSNCCSPALLDDESRFICLCMPSIDLEWLSISVHHNFYPS